MNLETAIDESLMVSRETVTFDGSFYAIEGMSGKGYRCFINHLIGSLDNPSYLEIGLWGGSTFCSAIWGNKVRAFGIDDWSGIPATGGAQIAAPRTEFFANLESARAVSPNASVNVIEANYRDIVFASLRPFDVFFFDGPHGKQDQIDGLRLALPAMKPNFIYIVDDWNWPEVREGTKEAIETAGLTVAHDISIKTSHDGSYTPGLEHDPWYNGCSISLLRKLQ